MNRFEQLVASWQAGEAELAPIATLLGIRPVSHGDGAAVVELEAGARLHNAMGTLHGGVLLDLADVAMGVALATTLAEGESFTTLQSSVSYLRAVREEKLTAAARVVQRGRSVGHLECEILDSDGRTVARATSVCAVRSQGANSAQR